MYLLLKENDIPFTYEGKTYTVLKSFEYPNECWERATRKSKSMIDRRKVRDVKYTPDFVSDDGEWVIETKGRANESFPLRWKMFKRYLTTDYAYIAPLIFKPTTKKDCEQVIEILKAKGYGKK